MHSRYKTVLESNSNNNNSNSKEVDESIISNFERLLEGQRNELKSIESRNLSLSLSLKQVWEDKRNEEDLNRMLKEGNIMLIHINNNVVNM